MLRGIAVVGLEGYPMAQKRVIIWVVVGLDVYSLLTINVGWDYVARGRRY